LVGSRNHSEDVTKVSSALLNRLQSGTKVVLIDLPGLGDDDVPMANVYGMLERVTAGCKGIDAFLLCHKASSTRVQPSVKQAARLYNLAISSKTDFGAFTLCFTQTETSNAKQVANMPEFVEHFICNKLRSVRLRLELRVFFEQTRRKTRRGCSTQVL
jgi:hypothetical protein